MLSLYPTRYMKTDKLWSDWTRIQEDIDSVEKYLQRKDILSLPSIAVGALNKIPVNGFYPEEEVWFYALHAEWLAKRPKFLSVELFMRGEDVRVCPWDYCGKFSADILLYSRSNLITVKQQCQSWLIDRGQTCNIQSQSHLRLISQEIQNSDYWKNV